MQFSAIWLAVPTNPPVGAGTPPPDSATSELWQHAPCGLIQTDAVGRITEVNTTFLDWSGYARSEIVGKRRFADLLTPAGRILYESQLVPMVALDGKVSELGFDLVLANQRRAPVLVNASVSGASSGALPMRFAIVAIEQRRNYERELIRTQHAVQEASDAIARSQRRLRLIADATMALASAADTATAIGDLADVLVDALGDWCLILTPSTEDPQRLVTAAAAHAEVARLPELQQLGRLLPEHATADSAVRRVLVDSAPRHVGGIDRRHLEAATNSEEFRVMLEKIGAAHALVVPVLVRGNPVASVLLVRTVASLPFDDYDLEDVVNVSGRAGLLIDNIRLHAQDHGTAVALQQALLTAPPQTNGLQIESRYVAATDGADVGGDWFDAFSDPSGTTVLVIGDVVGHDIRAAASMGQLRGLLRAIAYTSGDTPAGVLRQTDQAAQGLHVDDLATAIVARLGPATDGEPARVLQWSNAGHPPPVLIDAVGRATMLCSDHDLMLGVHPQSARQNHTARLGPGTTVIFYTDGLVENRVDQLETGPEGLRQLLAQHAHKSLADVCDAVVAEVTKGPVTDDIALLAIRLCPN